MTFPLTMMRSRLKGPKVENDFFVEVSGRTMKQRDRTLDYFNQHLDKVLFGVGFIYLVLVSGWLTSQNRLAWPWGTRSQQAAAPTIKAPLSTEDTQFIAYLQQSLKVLSQQNSLNKRDSRIALNSPPAPSSNVLPLSIQTPQNPPPSSTTPTVIERIYVPVYPPQSSQTPQYAPRSLPKTIFSPSHSTVLALPRPASVIRPKLNIAPLVTRTTPYSLVGVLESGDLSSALFSENGLTQRIQLGERVGSSDWTLMEIENQKAILSRQGKTRYLEVGQSF